MTLKRAALVLVAIVVLAIGTLLVWSQRIVARPYPTVPEVIELPTDSGSIAEGERLARLRGCFDGCHGQGLAGRVFVEERWVGRISAPNLGWAARTYSVAELESVIRHGVKNDGRSVFIMPSDMFSHLSDEDLASIIAFMRSEPEVEGVGRIVSIGPLGRLGLVLGEFTPVAAGLRPDDPHPRSTPPSDGTVERGRYLALTVCSECHGDDLRGDPFTPDLAAVAAYSLDQFRALMATGVPAGGGELDLMRQVALGRFSHFTDREVVDLYGYLRTLSMGADAPDAVFAEPVAVYLTGSLEWVDSLRASVDPEAFGIIADDLMYYRASAWEWIEERGIPLVTLEGRPRLGFVVDGETEVLDLAPYTTIDLVILYEPGAEPRVMAPIHVPQALTDEAGR